MRIKWRPVLARARDIVLAYDTSVTLRQLFYRLVSEQLLPNTTGAYSRLSEYTAVERRAGRFPDLIDRTRSIHRDSSWPSPGNALNDLAMQYRRDRTEGQDWSVYLGIEKAGIVEQLSSWFGDLGVPILSLGGYTSQSYAARVTADVQAAGRQSVLLYGGDFDASGEDIDRDFIERTNCFDRVVRVALDAGQVASYNLPVNPGKASDPRAAGFVERHGELVQVEIDALDPEDLRALYQEALEPYWHAPTYDALLSVEETERAQLTAIAEQTA